MSKGISELQKWILLVCLENRFASTKELLCAWFDCEPADWWSKKASIGWAEYNKAHASLSRSISRLWQRGLVIIWKNLTYSATGITMTDVGKAIAQSISDKESIEKIIVKD